MGLRDYETLRANAETQTRLIRKHMNLIPNVIP